MAFILIPYIVILSWGARFTGVVEYSRFVVTCRAVLLLAIPPVYEELVARLVVGQAQERTLLIRPCVLLL